VTSDLGSWHSAEYVAEWAGDDVIAEMLDFPRRLTVGITADAGSLQNRTSVVIGSVYFAGQVAEIMRTEETRSRCAFMFDVLPPLDASEPEVPVVPVAEVEPVVPLLVDPCVVSSVPVTSI